MTLKGSWLAMESSDQLTGLLQRYGLESQISDADFRQMQAKWVDIISEMDDLCFDPGFGFVGTTMSDWCLFLEHERTFQLSLNREPGRSILYGLDHVRCRQALFNQMPRALRVAVFCEKVRAIALETGFLAFDTACTLDQLNDVQDIGMGHSIYECDFGHRKVVVKHRPYDVQCAYMRLMAVMGWKTFDHYFYQNPSGGWEFSESLGNQNCNDYLLQKESSESIEAALARKAAIGDVLGIGDRHFENYMIQGGGILSVDVSILFWPDNENWSATYVAAGLYEVTSLRCYANDLTKLQQHWTTFFEHYTYYVDVLAASRSLLSEELSQIFSATESKRCSAFLEERLSDPMAYVKKQKSLYLDGFLTCLERLVYKEALQALYEQNSTLFEFRPLYKMAVLADRGRLSAFLHAEKHDGFFEELQSFLHEHDDSFMVRLAQVHARVAGIKSVLITL